QAVSLMLIRVEARCLEEMSKRVGGIKAAQTNALMHIYREAMDAWERSKQASKVMTRTLEGKGEGAEGQGGRVRIKDQDGDPRYRDTAKSTLADIRKIWGVEAPKETRLTGKDGGPMEFREKKDEPDLSKLSLEELRALRAIQDKLAGTVVTE